MDKPIAAAALFAAVAELAQTMFGAIASIFGDFSNDEAATATEEALLDVRLSINNADQEPEGFQPAELKRLVDDAVAQWRKLGIDPYLDMSDHSYADQLLTLVERASPAKGTEGKVQGQVISPESETFPETGGAS
jgi:hypothetical protein